jgi:hypothetical protein
MYIPLIIFTLMQFRVFHISSKCLFLPYFSIPVSSLFPSLFYNSLFTFVYSVQCFALYCIPSHFGKHYWLAIHLIENLERWNYGFLSQVLIGPAHIDPGSLTSHCNVCRPLTCYLQMCPTLEGGRVHLIEIVQINGKC